MQSQERISQCKTIIEHLNAYGSITQKEAVADYGIYRLSARIFDLRDLGYDIKTVMLTGKSRLGGTSNYAKYILNPNGSINHIYGDKEV